MCVAATTAAAQTPDVSAAAPAAPAADVPAPDAYGAGAMPGGLHVPSAEAPAVGTVSFEGLSGFGYRKGLLGPDHRFGRVIGDLAVAYTLAPGITAGLELDGRYDRHYGLAPSGDDGYVGDPHVVGRYVSAPSGGLRFGAELGVWVPGKDAPSIAGSAISGEVEVFATIPAGPGKLSAMAGYQLDRSAKSVDMIDSLSLQDRVSLGVSDFDEVVGGLRYAVASGKSFVGVEASVEAFVGTGAPSPIFRGTLTAGTWLSPSLALAAYVEGAKDPDIELTQVMDANIPIVPYEPLVTGGLGLYGHWGGRAARTGSLVTEKDCAKHSPPDCAGVKVPITADITGTIVDQAGAPIVGAKVTLTLKSSTVAPAVTDDKGSYTFSKVPIGNTVDGVAQIDESAGQIGVELDGKKPASVALPLAAGANTAPRITLEAALPPGELRGIVTSLATGQPIKDAKVTIDPGGKTVATGADGKFTVDLPPGDYKVAVTAPGMAKQDLDATIDTNGVTTKNINMHR